MGELWLRIEIGDMIVVGTGRGGRSGTCSGRYGLRDKRGLGQLVEAVVAFAGERMKLQYCPETDSLSIELKLEPGADTREVADGLYRGH